MIISENKIHSYNVKEDIPIPLPHYTVQNGKLLFMDYKEKLLDTPLMSAFSKITGQCTISMLWEKHHISIETIMELEKKRLIVIKKNREAHKNFRTKISVLSPHFDDTVFSLGGILNKYIDEVDWKIIDVFGKQDYTLYSRFYERDKNKNFALYEEKIALELMGLESFDYWDIEEVLLRGVYKEFGFMQESAHPEYIIQAEIDCYNLLCNCMRNSRSLNECEVILCPLGIGHHVDHILVRQACIQLFFGKKPILFFEDLPYALGFSIHPIVKWLSSFLGVRLTQKPVDITKCVSQKQYLASIYQSQVRVSQVESMVGYGLHENQYYENMWVHDTYKSMTF